jgi:hypothetical protein
MICCSPCSEPNARACAMACFLGRGVAGQGSGSVRDEQYSCVNHDYSRYHGICCPHRHLTHPRTQWRSRPVGPGIVSAAEPPVSRCRRRSWPRRRQRQTAAISSSMTCFTSGPNGAFSVASLIRVLAWRRPERSGATRSRSRQGPASARSTADRAASGRQASVQVRLGAERHGALDGIESDKDELLRDQHDLSVFRTRGRGQIRLSTAATTTAVAPAVLFG